MKESNSDAPAGHILSLEEVAVLVGGRVEGDPSIRVRGIAPLDQACQGEMGFLAQRRYLKHLDTYRAEALLVSEDLAGEAGFVPGRVVVKEAHASLPPLLEHFYPAPEAHSGIHPTAVLGRGVELGVGVAIGPYAVLEEGARVGDRSRIGPHCVVGAGCLLGADSVLHPHAVLYPGTQLGARVILHAGVCLGVDGFGYIPVEGEQKKVPQVGMCIVGDDVEIGANTCIDRGSIGQTTLGRGTKLDNLVHMGHNVQVGEGVMITGQVGFAGSSRIGDGVVFGGQAGIGGHLEIGAGAQIAGQAGVIGNIPAGAAVSGFPARDNREYLRAMSLAFKLPETHKRLAALEKRLGALEGTSGEA